MQVKARGWRRRELTHTLFDRELQGREVRDSRPDWLTAGNVYITKETAQLTDSDPVITIQAQSAYVQMKGDYLLTISLSKADIRALAREVIGDETLRELLAQPEAAAQPQRIRRRPRLRVVA
ncbi:hypothetical protein [Dongia sp.]|uniref:hypothetical protein n=1 Tax=Dongia sp. TaxID=1977262 RepID=UPI003751EC57